MPTRGIRGPAAQLLLPLAAAEPLPSTHLPEPPRAGVASLPRAVAASAPTAGWRLRLHAARDDLEERSRCAELAANVAASALEDALEGARAAGVVLHPAVRSPLVAALDESLAVVRTIRFEIERFNAEARALQRLEAALAANPDLLRRRGGR